MPKPERWKVCLELETKKNLVSAEWCARAESAAGAPFELGPQDEHGRQILRWTFSSQPKADAVFQKLGPFAHRLVGNYLLSCERDRDSTRHRWRHARQTQGRRQKGRAA